VDRLEYILQLCILIAYPFIICCVRETFHKIVTGTFAVGIFCGISSFCLVVLDDVSTESVHGVDF
jgi:hypothetical protein